MTLDELKAIGTDEEFLDFIRRQPSCLSGQFSEYVEDGRRNPACHVRRVKYGSGMATKGRYNAVPMTHAEHHTQHGRGELAALQSHGGYGNCVTHECAKQWFEEQVEKYRRLWAESLSLR